MNIKSLILLVLAPAITMAQTLEYEVIRTEEAPGFFAVRLFPGQDLQPEYLEDIFVKNFATRSEAKPYVPILEELTKLGAKVLDENEVRPYLFDEKYRVIVLGGETIPDFAQFKLKNAEEPLKQFQDFTNNYLGPIYLKNIKADFGGNVSEVVPESIPYLNQQATYFIGKFEKPMKTRMELNALNQETKFKAELPLNLETFTPHEISGLLPSLWEKVQKEPLEQVRKISYYWALNAFPIILAIIGITLILISLKKSKSEKKIDRLDETFWNTPIEETPLYKEWEKNLPFETKKME